MCAGLGPIGVEADLDAAFAALQSQAAVSPELLGLSPSAAVLLERDRGRELLQLLQGLQPL